MGLTRRPRKGIWVAMKIKMWTKMILKSRSQMSHKHLQISNTLKLSIGILAISFRLKMLGMQGDHTLSTIKAFKKELLERERGSQGISWKLWWGNSKGIQTGQKKLYLMFQKRLDLVKLKSTNGDGIRKERFMVLNKLS